jgi:subtilisin family serine protease
METPQNPYQIPPAYADYTRRLIMYTTKARARVARIDQALRAYDAKTVVPDFRLGDLRVRSRYIGDPEVSVAEVISDVAPKRFAADWVFEPDVRLSLSAAPNDPLYHEQWALEKIHAEGAWDRVTQAHGNRPPVVVAIVDSGAKADHEDFLNSAGVTTVGGTRVLAPAGANFADDTGHGTMLSGIIAAVSNNRVGVSGIGSVPVPGLGAPNISAINLYEIKIDDARNPPTALPAAIGFLLAANQGARVINASWHALDQGFLYNAISSIGSLNRPILVVAAAGNQGRDNDKIPTLPASYRGSVRGAQPLDNLISVMASDENDNKCWFSNYGATVDLAAPGKDVLSTSLYFASPPPPPTPIYSPAYRKTSGTSAAAAFVSAAAGLLLAIDDWTPAEIRDHLVASADMIPNLQGAGRVGARLNLRRAVHGPFSITVPAGGTQLQAGSTLTVQWSNEYQAPIVNSVEVSFRDANAPSTVLGGVAGGLGNTGSASVTVPGPTPQAFIRLRCEQKNIYADSDIFTIV